MSDEENGFVLIDANDVHLNDGDGTSIAQSPQTRAKIQKWLSPSEYAAESSDYNKHLRSYCPHTGEWLRQSSSYLAWHHETKSALWVNGIPGSGKSVVAASLINDMLDNEKAPVLYFFFRYANLANRTPKQMIRDWLSQLLNHSPSLQLQLKDLIEKNHDHEAVTFETLWSCFNSAATALPGLYCVADALDEMEGGNEWILPKLVSLGRQRPATLKVIITSRQSPHIVNVLKEPLVTSISLERGLIDQDIATYINHSISTQPAMGVQVEQSQLVKDTIQRKANGLFIYAKLMMDEVLSNFQSRNIEIMLEELPIGMDQMYTTLLNEHSRRSGVSRDLQVLILHWITHATRPLRLLEVAELIRAEPLGQGLGRMQEIKNTVRSACGPLLTLLPDETLQVIHHSFTEFLVDPTRRAQKGTDFATFHREEVHRAAAITCIDYIITCSKLSTRAREVHAKDPLQYRLSHGKRDELFLEYPFLQYATSHWMVHARASDAHDDLLLQALDRFLDVCDNHFAYWQGIWHISRDRPVRGVIGPLHAVSLFGLSQYVAELCKRGVDVNVQDSKGYTPLSYACKNGHYTVVCQLLDNGASCSITSKYGVAPIHYACVSNSPALVKRLLEAGADPFSETVTPDYRNVRREEDYSEMCQDRQQFGINALEHACTQGYGECLKIMLDSLETEKYHPGPLHWASKAGQHDMVDLLLTEYHLNPNDADTDGNTPLCLAAHQRSPLTVKTLLKHGASVNRTSTGIDTYRGISNCVRDEEDFNRVSPLHAWACGSSRGDATTRDMTETCLILIEAGCDVNMPDSEGKTPIFWWANSLNMETSFIEVLGDHGASAAMEDQFGNTPLHFCRNRASDQNIQALLKHGGDLNTARHIDGRTPLMCVIQYTSGSSSNDCVAWVEQFGLNPNAQDLDGQTILHYLLKHDRWDIEGVQKWVTAGADPKIEDNNGRNCFFMLHTRYIRMVDNEGRLMKLLTAAGLNIQATDHRGFNLLLDAIGNGDLAYLKRLKDYGVDSRAKCLQGRTALHVLANQEMNNGPPREQDECLRFFLDEGLKINDQDHAGNTMGHVAFGNTEASAQALSHLLQATLEAGLDPNVRNHQGRTILHIAAGTPVATVSRREEDKEVLDLLFSAHLEMDVNLADYSGVTPLHIAATKCAIRVNKLLSAGSDITMSDHQKRNALHHAARAGNSNVVASLIKTFKEKGQGKMINQRDCNGRTALHDAVRSGDPGVVQILLNSSADPNIRDHRGRGSLHAASENLEERMLRSLRVLTENKYPLRRREWGYDFVMPNYKCHPGGIRIDDASRPLSTEKNDEDEVVVKRSIVGGASRIRDVVRALLVAGADPYQKDDDGLNALYAAIKNGCVEVACLLHDEKPDVGMDHEQNGQKADIARFKFRRWRQEQESLDKVTRDLIKTPQEATSLLIPAVTEGDEYMLKALLSIGADPLQVDESGNTALHLAAGHGLTTIIQLLIENVPEGQKLPSNLLPVAARREGYNLETIKVLITSGCDIHAIESNAEDRYGSQYNDNNKSVAHVLAVGEYWWQPTALDYLLKAGLNPECKTSKGRTALHIAMRGRFDDYDRRGFWRKNAMTALLDHGVNVNVIDTTGTTPLFEAFEDHGDTVNTLITYGADVDFGPLPPIVRAASVLNIEAIEALLKAGVDCNYSPKDYVAQNCQEHVLLEVGHSMTRSQGNWVFRDQDPRSKVEQVIEILIGAGADTDFVLEDGTPLITAIVTKYGVIKPFVSAGKNIEVCDTQGMTPFLAACAARQPRQDILKELIQVGANPMAVDNSGKNAIHWAVINASIFYKNVFTDADIFLDNGVPVNVLDNNGMSPLHYAIKKGTYMDPPVIRRLLDAGADASIPYPDKATTSLHILLPSLAEGGQDFNNPPSLIEPLVQHFIDAGVDKEARDSDGNTPIFGYVSKQTSYDDEYEQSNRYPDLDEQRRVLQGYNIHAKNNAGETLLHVVAKRSSHNVYAGGRDDTRDMFKLLWDMGLDPACEDAAQRTPLDVAAATGNTGILDLFAPENIKGKGKG